MSESGGQKRITTRDVAKACGVHNATVSRALSGSPLVNRETRDRVLQAAERLGYRPDPFLGALAEYRKRKAGPHYQGTLGWLWSGQDTNPEIHRRLRYYLGMARAAAEPMGYKIDEIPLDAGRPESTRRVLLARGVRGLLVPPQKEAGSEITMPVEDFSVVRVGNSLVAPHFHMVGPTQFANMRRLVSTLRTLGYRRIGLWIPRLLDDRPLNAHSAGYHQEQLSMPPGERLKPGLPDDWSQTHFAAWFKTNRPDVVVGPLRPLKQWLIEAASPCRVVWCDDFNFVDQEDCGVDEDYLSIFGNGLLMLDSMIRHGERGIPQHPTQLLVEGKLRPPPPPE